MKNKILSAFLSLVILLSLAGCGNQTVRQNSDKTVNGTSSAGASSDTEISDGITAEEIKTNPTAVTTEETTASLYETPVTDLQKNTVDVSEPTNQTAEPNSPEPQKDTGIPSQSTITATEKPTQTAYEDETESSETDTPPTPTKPSEKPKPTETSAPVTETEPAFDIGYWISYAQNYAKSVGLRLDNSAVDCWDNPIPANAKRKYLERDIKNRLNRYAKDEDITDVWIWAEKVSDNSYEIYIGYA